MDKTLNCVYWNQLFDLYGNLLNEREKEIFKLFYEEDYSLQEIADLRGISKSAVGNTVKIITKKLEEYEEKLHFLEKIEKIKKYIGKTDLYKKIEEILSD